MTLMEKFATLTPEQRENFAAVKDAAGLDTFASEHDIDLTDEEKAQAAEYFEKGTLPLSDDELDMVAGGAGKAKSFAELAKSENRPFMVGHGSMFSRIHTQCPRCGPREEATVFARGERTGGSLYHHTQGFWNSKCYSCGATWNSLEFDDQGKPLTCDEQGRPFTPFV